MWIEFVYVYILMNQTLLSRFQCESISDSRVRREVLDCVGDDVHPQAPERVEEAAGTRTAVHGTSDGGLGRVGEQRHREVRAGAQKGGFGLMKLTTELGRAGLSRGRSTLSLKQNDHFAILRHEQRVDVTEVLPVRTLHFYVGAHVPQLFSKLQGEMSLAALFCL